MGNLAKHFKVTENLEGLEGPVREAICAIERVHGIDPAWKMPTVWVLRLTPVSPKDGFHTMGLYHRPTIKVPLLGSLNRLLPPCIHLTKDCTSPHLFFVHEFGHALDHLMGGYHDFQSAQHNTPIGEIVDTAKRTPLYVNLNKLVETRDLAPNQRAILLHTLRPCEIWAHAYSHYIALRSGHEVMLRTIERNHRKKLHYQVYLKHDEFEPIAEMIDALFAPLRTKESKWYV